MFAGNKGETFVGLMGRSLSSSGELKNLKETKPLLLLTNTKAVLLIPKNIKLLWHIEQLGLKVQSEDNRRKMSSLKGLSLVFPSDSFNRINPHATSSPVDILEKPENQGRNRASRKTWACFMSMRTEQEAFFSLVSVFCDVNTLKKIWNSVLGSSEEWIQILYWQNCGI